MIANILGVLIIIGILVFLGCLVVLSGPRVYVYKFEERTVLATYLEEARGRLKNYHSPLIETDDPSIV